MTINAPAEAVRSFSRTIEALQSFAPDRCVKVARDRCIRPVVVVVGSDAFRGARSLQLYPLWI